MSPTLPYSPKQSQLVTTHRGSLSHTPQFLLHAAHTCSFFPVLSFTPHTLFHTQLTTTASQHTYSVLDIVYHVTVVSPLHTCTHTYAILSQLFSNIVSYTVTHTDPQSFDKPEVISYAVHTHAASWVVTLQHHMSRRMSFFPLPTHTASYNCRASKSQPVSDTGSYWWFDRLTLICLS